MMHDDPDHSISEDAPSMIEFQSPGRFQIDNPAAQPALQQEWHAAPFTLGVSTTVQAFNDMGEARKHALALIEQVRRSLSIYTPDLEPWLYNHSCIQKACSQFLRAHPRNRLRILVGDECGVLIRPNADQFSGHALYRDPGRARQQLRLFDAAWDRSLPDPDMRSFLL